VGMSLFKSHVEEAPSILLKHMVSAAGLEPATHALKGHCSTN
jgi:hypothetical protein